MFNSSESNFKWANYADPHRARRKLILEKYPEIQELIGPESRTKYIALALLFTQLLLAFYTQHLGLFGWFILLYFVGATVNHSLFTAIHEITHHLAFKSLRANRYFAILINLPLGIPVAMGFEKYHLSHHRYLGDLQRDVDIPFEFEAKLFNSRIGKSLWLLIQPFTYALRPLFKLPSKLTFWEKLNIISQLLFNVLVAVFIGWKCLVFLILSTRNCSYPYDAARHMGMRNFLPNTIDILFRG